MFKKEEWKDIPNYEGYYQASNLGNIRRVGKNRNLGLTAKSGYYQVMLCVNGIKKYISVHNLVADTFLTRKRDGRKLVVDHINNIKTDNRPENLQIVTQRINNSKDSVGTSKYTGVSFEKAPNKWRADILINGKKKFLGRFVVEEDAAKAYEKEFNKLKEENYEYVKKV